MMSRLPRPERLTNDRSRVSGRLTERSMMFMITMPTDDERDRTRAPGSRRAAPALIRVPRSRGSRWMSGDPEVVLLAVGRRPAIPAERGLDFEAIGELHLLGSELHLDLDDLVHGVAPSRRDDSGDEGRERHRGWMRPGCCRRSPPWRSQDADDLGPADEPRRTTLPESATSSGNKLLRDVALR